MREFLYKRIIQAFLVVIFISATTFFVLNIVPGDPVRIMMGEQADEATVAQVRSNMGLDKPVLEQYANWVSKMLIGDFGVSYTQQKPVIELIGKALMVTLRLAGVAFVVACLVGIGIGVIAAVFRGRPIEHVVMTLTVLGISAPAFWVAIIIQIIFGLQLKWFPLSGAKTFASFVLPTFALATRYAASIARITRTAMLDALAQDCMRTAKAKGLSRVRIVCTHAIRCAYVPIITIAGAHMAEILTGSIIIESVFAMPGVGKLVLDAINARDLPLIEGAVMYIACICVVVYVLVDVLYACADPRIRFTGEDDAA